MMEVHSIVERRESSGIKFSASFSSVSSTRTRSVE
jgi:hypothetical protein